MVQLIDKLLDFFDELAKRLKGFKFPEFKDNSVTKWTLITMAIASFVAFLKSLFGTKKIEEVQWGESVVLKPQAGIITSTFEGEVAEVTGDTLTIKSGDTVYQYKGVFSNLEVGQQVFKGQEIGKSSSAWTTFKPGKIITREVSNVQFSLLGSVSEVKLSDAEFKRLQESYKGGFIKEQATDNKKYQPGCPSKGLFGRPQDYDGSILFCMETLMTMCEFNRTQAAGIVGCLMAESQLLPIAFNRVGGNYGAQGIAQWRASRVEEYIKQYSKMPCLDNSLSNQISFVAWELNHTHKSAKPSEESTLSQAAAIGFYKYEGAGEDPNAILQVRVNNASYAYNLYVKTHPELQNSVKKEEISSTVFGYNRQ